MTRGSCVHIGQCARQLTEHFDGFLLGKRYLTHDRDRTFTDAFDAMVKDSGGEPVVLPPHSPNVNAYGERCVRSIQEEALGRMICIGDASLRHAIRSYLRHDHAERNHQSLDNQLITPEPEVGRASGPVKRRKRLGGMLSYYYREVA
jgi:putative transposase